MTIRVISIGKTNVDFVQEGLNTYLGRLKHYTKFSWEELPDVKKVDRTNAVQLKEKEGQSFLQHIKGQDIIILLDERGKSMTSQEFSSVIQDHQIYGQGDLVFIIGGAYGFSKSLYERAQRKISLSGMTFNHQMVRLIIAEQLYRAFTIIRGEPYHHS